MRSSGSCRKDTAIHARRTFNEQDRAGAQLVAIVNETFVKTYPSQSEPFGHRLQSEAVKGQSILIVGVAADVLPEAGAASRPALYVPFSQFPVPGIRKDFQHKVTFLKISPATPSRYRRLVAECAKPSCVSK
jgi:hypothetical protein